MAERKKRLLIVEDHPIVREGIRNILERDSSLMVAYETGDAEKALSFAEKNIPDLALVDITLAGSNMNGIELTAALSRLHPRIPVVVLTVHAKIDYVGQAIDAGAYGYVNKESKPKVLHEAIQKALNKEWHIDGCFTPEIIRKLRESTSDERKVTDAPYGSLTKREQETLKLLSKGLSTKEVGQKFGISNRTAENYRSAIYKKLKLRNRTELYRYCTNIGLIDADTW